jgi:hypothetical protein
MRLFIGLVVLIFVFALGFLVGRLSVFMVFWPAEEALSVERPEIEMEDVTPAPESDKGQANAAAERVLSPSTEEAFRFSVSNLPPAQQSILRTFGVSGEEIIVTKAMYECMTTKLSIERLDSIKSGVAPSITEAVTLVSCYTAN